MSNINASNIWEKKTNKVPYEKCKKGKGPKKVSPYVESFIVKLENRPRTLSPSLKKNILGKKSKDIEDNILVKGAFLRLSVLNHLPAVLCSRCECKDCFSDSLVPDRIIAV